MTTNPIISKIQKLLATAADPAATPAESNTAMTLAQRLMAVHRITDRELAAHARAARIAAGETHVDDLQTLVFGVRKVRQHGWLGMAVAAVCGCDVYCAWEHTRTPSGEYTARKVITGYGLPTDLAVAKELYQWACEKMRDETRTFAKDFGVSTNSLQARSFMDGFSCALLEKANAAKEARMRSTERIEIPQQSTTGAPCGALVVVVGEAEQMHEQALVAKKKQLGLGKGRASRARSDVFARCEGAAAASKVNLNRNAVR